jgi:hypothetical protein
MIKIKEGGSAWQLATWFGCNSVDKSLCPLVWTMGFSFMCISIICTALGAYLGCMAATIAASIASGTMIWSIPMGITVGLIVAVLVIACIACVSIFLGETNNKTIKNIKTSYSAWHDKVCPMVELIKK